MCVRVRIIAGDPLPCGDISRAAGFRGNTVEFIEWTFCGDPHIVWPARLILTVVGPGTQHGTTFQVCPRNCLLLLVPRAGSPEVLATLLNRRPSSVATGDWPLAWMDAVAMLIAARSLDPSSTLAARADDGSCGAAIGSAS